MSKEEALEVLKAAGTRADYTGLWDAVRKFEPPTVPAGPLVESAEVQPITGAMVRIDHHWSGIEPQLKADQIADAQAFAREALLLAEEFRELPRTSPSTDEEFKAQMKSAIATTEALQKAAETNDLAAIQATSKKVLQSCIDCHARFRNE